MKFTKITVFTTEENIEILTCRLSDLGADGFELSGGSELAQLIDSTDPDLIDDKLFNLLGHTPGEAGIATAGSASVTVYIPEVTDHSKIIEFLHSEDLEYTTGEVAEADWENNWKAYFTPIPVGNRLVIKPSWCEYENLDNRLVVEIDPASAFGTGQHATTRMCLELLEAHVGKGERVVDIGCGSGILSAAAGLLGADYIVCVDISENAMKVTAETLAGNYSGNYKLYCGDIIADSKLRRQVTNEWVDVITANLTADIIIAMSDIFFEFDGAKTLILSGIIEPRLPETLAAVKPRFNVTETRRSEGWVALVCSKKWYKRI
jgi:ribosomal protein L11 methyltransferase